MNCWRDTCSILANDLFMIVSCAILKASVLANRPEDFSSLSTLDVQIHESQPVLRLCFASTFHRAASLIQLGQLISSRKQNRMRRVEQFLELIKPLQTGGGLSNHSLLGTINLTKSASILIHRMAGQCLVEPQEVVLDFGGVLQGSESSVRCVDLINATSRSNFVEIREDESNDTKSFSLSPSRSVIAHPSGSRVDCILDTSELGSVSSRFLLTVDGAPRPVSLTLLAKVEPLEIEIDSKEIDFKNVFALSEQSRQLFIYNRTGCTVLAKAAASSQGLPLSCFPASLTLPPHSKRPVTVKIDGAVVVGSANGTVTLVIGSGTVVQRFEVPVKAAVVVPKYSISVDGKVISNGKLPDIEVRPGERMEQHIAVTNLCFLPFPVQLSSDSKLVQIIPASSITTAHGQSTFTVRYTASRAGTSVVGLSMIIPGIHSPIRLEASLRCGTPAIEVTLPRSVQIHLDHRSLAEFTFVCEQEGRMNPVRFNVKVFNRGQIGGNVKFLPSEQIQWSRDLPEWGPKLPRRFKEPFACGLWSTICLSLMR